MTKHEAVVDFLNSFDGHGLVVTDEELLGEAVHDMVVELNHEDEVVIKTGIFIFAVKEA
jgi:hypothetical protein